MNLLKGTILLVKFFNEGAVHLWRPWNQRGAGQLVSIKTITLKMQADCSLTPSIISALQLAQIQMVTD
jgi:hypothetical protein